MKLNGTVQASRPKRCHAMIVTVRPTELTSIPLATFTVRPAEMDIDSDLPAIHQSLCEFIGHTTGKGIAIQTLEDEVMFYGNVLTPFVGKLAAKPDGFLEWLRNMNVMAARAAVLNFALRPFCPVTPTPFLEGECTAVEDLNRYLAATGRLLEPGNYIERHGDQYTVVGGPGVPSPAWFLGLPRCTW